MEESISTKKKSESMITSLMKPLKINGDSNGCASVPRANEVDKVSCVELKGCCFIL